MDILKIRKNIAFEILVPFCIFLFAFFPLLPEKVKGLPVIFLFIISTIYFVSKPCMGFNITGLLKLSSIYIINILSIFYSLSFYFPGARAETTLALLIIPFSFFMLNNQVLNNIRRNDFYLTFVISVGILTAYSFFFYCLDNLFIIENFKVNSFRSSVTKLPFIYDHPIYISMYLGISLMLIVPLLKRRNKLIRLLLIIIGLLNIGHIILLSSKAVIIGIILGFIVYVLLYLDKILKKFVFVLTILVVSIISIISFPTLERRFRELTIKTTYTELHVNNSSSIRLAIFKCAFHKIEEKPILGYGWGLGNKSLSDCYKTKSEHLTQNSYNSHNQFLGYFLDGGIIAFFVLILFLSEQFRFAYMKSDYTFLMVLILFTTLMMTENILQRQSGVIPFIFLICFLRFVGGSEDVSYRKNVLNK